MERDLALTVLDHELVDGDGERCGRVDDIELEIAGSRCVPTAVVVGRKAMRRRLGNGLFGRLVERVVAVANHRIEWDEVVDVTHVVKLRRAAGSYGLARSDARLERHLKRSPEADAVFLSELLQMTVSTADGTILGRVIDVRLDEETTAICGIVVDDSRFLSKLVRGRAENGRTLPLPALPWSAVIRIDKDTVVVDPDSETLRAGSEKP